MPRGRPKLTERDKLNRKMERLQQEIELIKSKLAIVSTIEVLKENKEDRPFIEKGV